MIIQSFEGYRCKSTLLHICIESHLKLRSQCLWRELMLWLLVSPIFQPWSHLGWELCWFPFLNVSHCPRSDCDFVVSTIFLISMFTRMKPVEKWVRKDDQIKLGPILNFCINKKEINFLIKRFTTQKLWLQVYRLIKYKKYRNLYEYKIEGG